MSTTIDNKVVQMQFNNAQFEKNVKTSMSTIDHLKKSLNFSNSAKSLDAVNQAANKMSFDGLSNGISTIQTKFSALQVMAVTALANVTNSAINAGKKIAAALIIDPVKGGLSEYELQIESTQTIMGNTGKSVKEVGAALDELNDYADLTIYNFGQMTKNAGMFTASGMGLEDTMKTIKGVGNWAAYAGANSNDMSRATYQLAQGLSSGAIVLRDWMSVENAAGMAGEKYREAFMETARQNGIDIDGLIDKYGSFRETLKEQWLTTDIFMQTMDRFADDPSMTDAATKVKTFTQLMGAAKEALETGWGQTWKLIIGDFEEARDLWSGVQEFLSGDNGIITSAANARNELLQGWRDFGGREMLLKAIKKGFESVLSIVKPITEAFREIFPPMTAHRLFRLTVTLKNIAESFKLTDTQAANLKRTFKGVFAIISMVKTVVVSLFKGIKNLIGRVDGLNFSILETTGTWGDWLVNLDNIIKNTNTVQDVLKAFGGFIKGTFAKVKDVFVNIGNSISAFGKAIHIDFRLPEFKLFSALMSRIGARTTQVKDGVLSATGPITAAFAQMDTSGMKVAKSNVLGKLANGFAKVKQFARGAAKAVGEAKNKIAESLSNADFNGIFDLLAGVSLGGLTIGINKFLKKLTEPMDSVSGGLSGIAQSVQAFIGSFKAIPDEAVKILDSLRGCFEAYQARLKADALLKIAGAVAILAGSILLLSLIDSEKMAIAVGGITGLFANLMGAMAVFTKVSGNIKNTTKAVASLIGMSVAILIMATAMKKLGDLEWGDVAQGLVSIGVLAGIVTAAAWGISQNEKKLFKGAISLITFAKAIKILAGVCKDLSTLSWDELARGLTGVVVLLGSLAVFLEISNFDKKSVKAAIGIVALSLAIKVLASACKSFSDMSWEEIGKGLAGVAGTLAAIALFTQTVGSPKGLIKTGVAMVIVAGAMHIFASAVGKLSSFTWVELAKGMAAMATSLLIVAGASYLMPKNLVGIGVGLIAVGTALNIISSAVLAMSGMTWDEIGKGLVALGGSLLLLGIGLNMMKGTLGGSAALLVASAALAVLTPTLVTLASLSWVGIAKGLSAIAGSFVILGVAGAVLAPLVPVILGLAGALALVGIGVAATGIGLVALAAGFGTLAAIGVAGATAVVSALTVIIVGIIALIPEVATKIAEGIVAFAKAVADGAPSLCESVKVILLAMLKSLTEGIPAAMEVMAQLLLAVLGVISKYTPDILQAGYDILIALLEKLSENISKVVQTAIDIVLGFLDGVQQKIPAVVQKGWDLLIAFIDGITNAITENTPRLVESGRQLFLALINAMLLIVTGSLLSFKDAAKLVMESGLVQGIKDKYKSAKDAIQELLNNIKEKIEGFKDDLKDAGKNLINGFISGIDSRIGAAVEKAKELARSIPDTVKKLLGIKSPSRVFMAIGRYTGEGLVNGLAQYSSKVRDTASMVGNKAISAMQKAVAGVSNILDGNIDSEPTIRPVIDLSDAESKASQLYRMFNKSTGLSVSATFDKALKATSKSEQSGTDTKTTQPSSVGNSYTFNQNNYSPKALSRVEIYRQTRNQFSRMKDVVPT